MLRPIPCVWFLIAITVALPLACDKAPTSSPQIPKSDSNAEIPAAPAPAEEPTAEKPVVATAILRPNKGSNGDVLDLVVEIRIAAGWHIYAGDAPAGSAIPTSIVEKLPQGIEVAGAWQYPKAISAPEAPGGIYEDRLTLRRLLKINQSAQAGRIVVSCELTYQACDSFHCLPPQTLTLSAKGEVESAR
jgi:DsbC/DsbD-like thiol-disulfide interchange protein